MRIGIVGLGHVGKAMQELFAPRASVVSYDPLHDERYPGEEMGTCDFAVVCVSTPMAPTGECDVTNVVEAVSRVPVDKVLIKSTIPPGTTDDLVRRTGKQICFSPEYVGEANYFTPFWPAALEVPFVILGGEPSTRQVFVDFLVPVLGPSKTYFQCTAVEAELVKYMENCYLAMKVGFVNEFFEIANVVGADWHTVREGWLLDPRVERSHSAVFPNARGFSGKCLPKDISAIISASKKAGYDPELLEEVVRSNERHRRT